MIRLISFLFAVLFFVACKNDSESTTQSEPVQEQTNINNADPLNMQSESSGERPSQVHIPAGSDGIVHHYICSDRCEGGHSPNPGLCSNCGNPLAHNQAWHDDQPQSQTQTQNNPGQTIQTSPPVNLQATQASQIPPTSAQQPPEQVNIPAGPDGIVHHYICKDRCAGGHSPNSGNCPNCGKRLAHNQAWHNQ